MRTIYCGEVNQNHNDNIITLCGWVHRRRDHGGVIFVDLRDRTGLIQVVFDPHFETIFHAAESLRNEYVVKVIGKVRQRPEGLINANLATGHIEVLAQELTVLNSAKNLPFPLDEYHPVGELHRLEYRYLDLRRPEMFQRLAFRAQVARELRHFLDNQGFIDVETPALTRSTPEGSRDYLVPSRIQPNHFYALPQSPQQFKQLLMMSGFDRYYQIVRCFRDEDLRADRQPEFTQLDIETSFMNEEEIQALMENMIRQLFKKLLNIELPNPFPRMTYCDAMNRFGSDKPDLRIPLEMVDIKSILTKTEFKAFAEHVQKQTSRIACLRLPNGCQLLSRKQLDDYIQYVTQFEAKGMAYIKINDLAKGIEGLQSPILKFLSEQELTQIVDKMQAKTNDILFFMADKEDIVNHAMGAFRLQLGHDLNLYNREWCPLWVVDFPMFEQDKETGRWQAVHHPFTAPKVDSIEQLKANPAEAVSKGYDMVLNGSEIGGGSIRIHTMTMQKAIFDLFGISDEQAQTEFGHLLEAMEYGCPPHGGIAFGLDRLVMMMLKLSSIREVIAFPKTQTGTCPLMKAPSLVSERQLNELKIRLIKS